MLAVGAVDPYAAPEPGAEPAQEEIEAMAAELAAQQPQAPEDAAQAKADYDKAKSAGNLTGDSFGGISDDIVVTDIKGRYNADGGVDVEDVVAHKAETVEEINPALVVETAPELAHVKTFFRVDVSLPEGVEAEDAFNALGADRSWVEADAAANGVYDEASEIDGVVMFWVAFERLGLAKSMAEILTAKGFTAEAYGINRNGQRLVPKTATVVDTGAVVVEPPRAWNGRAAEIDAMTPDEREANDKTISGKDFVFCGNYKGVGKGCIVYIAPKTYFEEHDALYPHALDIDHLLPQGTEELGPGKYQMRNYNWNTLSLELAGKRGFLDSLLFHAMINDL
jgi:hypothetical protein